MKYNRIWRTVLIASILSLTTGCASFFGSPIDQVTIDSEPQNAAFSIVNQAGIEIASGTTPDVVELKTSSRMYKSARYRIDFEAAGHSSQSTELKAKVSPWYFVNVIASVPGLLGLLVIDPFTGAQFRLPDESSVVLVPLILTNSSSDAKPALESVQ